MTAPNEMLQRINRRLLSRADGHMAEVLSGAVLAFVLRAAGAALAFALNVVIGRLLGAEGAGLYFMALSVVMIAAVVARLGLDNVLLRFIASGASKNDWGQVKGVFALGMSRSVSVSLGLSLAVMVTAPWLASSLFNEPDLADTLRWMSLGIASFATMTLLSESLKGLKRVRNSMLVSGVIYPGVALIAVWPLASIFGAPGAALAYVLGTVVAVLIGWVMWHANTRDHAAPASKFDRPVLWQNSRPLWIMSIINRGILPWAPLFLLGIWGTAEEAGIFGAATRVAMLVSFFLVAVNTVIAPKFAELYTKGNIETLGRLACRFALLITLAASPLFLLLIFAGDWVMGMFGVEFSNGGTVLAILAGGQAVVAMTGVAGQILMMSGHVKDARNASILGFMVITIMATLTIPGYGAIGAAISNSLALSCMNIYSAFMAKKKLFSK